MVDKDHYGVHQTHCCFVDGCKYCDDDCPVVSGEIAQEYCCEDCPSYANPTVIHSIEVTVEQYKEYENNTKSYYVFDMNQLNAKKGHILVINEVQDQVKTGNSMRTYISDISASNKGMSDGFAIMSFNREYGY